MCTRDVQLGGPMDYILAAEPAWIIFSSLHTGLSLAERILALVAVCIFGCNACYTQCIGSKVAIIGN